MALAVAEGLNVPLHCQVWDPFSWWAKANRLDDYTTRKTQELFDRTIERSVAVATASRPMTNNYRNRFHVKAIPIISSYARTMARSAAAPVPGASHHGRYGRPIFMRLTNGCGCWPPWRPTIG